MCSELRLFGLCIRVATKWETNGPIGTTAAIEFPLVISQRDPIYCTRAPDRFFVFSRIPAIVLSELCFCCYSCCIAFIDKRTTISWVLCIGANEKKILLLKESTTRSILPFNFCQEYNMMSSYSIHTILWWCFSKIAIWIQIPIISISRVLRFTEYVAKL